MKNLLLSSVLLFASTAALYAQSASIKGTVSQSDSILRLAYVSVYLENSSIGAATNGNGDYLITEVPAGKHTLVVSAIGYFTQAQEIQIDEGESLQIDFYLTETISTLAEVRIMSGGEQGKRNVPGSVHYISPREIQKFNYTDINRTLRSVPGINIQEEDGFGLRPNIGLRGTGSERSSKITLMEDGILMAPAPYAAPAAYYFPTIGRMQGVEILKGSSQIQYGPFTTGGAINLISTQIPTSFSGSLHLTGGSFGGRNLHAFAGASHQNFAWLVETFQYGSNGFKSIDGGGNTGFHKQDYLAKGRVHTKADAKMQQSLTFKIGQTLETSHETYLGLTENDFGEDPFRRYAGSQKDEMIAEQLQLSVIHNIRFSPTVELTTTAYHNEFSRNWYKLDKVKDSTGTITNIGSLLEDPQAFSDAYDIITGSSSTNEDALFVKANNRDYFASGVQTELILNFNTGQAHHKVQVGARLHEDEMDRFQWVDEYAMDAGNMELTGAGTPGTESNRLESASAFAAYVQYKFNVGKLTATPGIRYENVTVARLDYGKSDPDRTGVDATRRSNHTGVFIPGIGLDYRFSDHLNVFAGIHKGFAPPGSKEETLPEKSINYELGSRWNIKAFSGEAVLFFNDYSNLLGSDLAASGGTGSSDLFNGGEVNSKGLELQLSYDVLASVKAIKFSLPLSVVYTYTDAVFQSSFESDFEGWGNVQEGDQLPYLANNQLSISIGLEHHKFNVYLSGKYLDQMRTAPGQGEIPENESTDAYFILDASASYALLKSVSLFANATNLSNRAYVVARRPAGLRPGMPGAYNVGLKARF